MTAALLDAAHADLLNASAIALDVAADAGVRSITVADQLPEPFAWTKSAPGILFPWHAFDGTTTLQYRPDTAVQNGDGHPRKYLFPKGAGSIINIHPRMRDRIGSVERLVIIEGTKQYLAGVSAAPADTLVVGIAGCWGWSHDQIAVPDLGRLVPTGGTVIVGFDADLATNRNVHDAATRLAESLMILGANKVTWINLPAGGKTGLDDFLATVEDRHAVFARLLERATPKLPRAPKPVLHNNDYFDENGLRAAALREAVRDREHLALDQSGRLLVYRAGVYTEGSREITSVAAELLGDMYRPMHLRSLLEPLEAELHTEGRVIPENPDRALVNVANGLLDPFTGTLHAHTPNHLSMAQLPVKWDPAATCPTFDRWLTEVADDRGDDLLEAVALVLDHRGQRQRKAVFLHGPTRSGKSTFVRAVEALVGHNARSAVTLHELTSDRFACADLFGKVLNTANELSGSHVDDLSTFKQVTGDDPVRAQHKYGRAFVFRNRALFIFAGNELPTVSEISGAYLARVRPYRFPHSFEGHEDPTLEQRIRQELPGILVRLVEAIRRFEQRGNYLVDDRSQQAINDFARHSDRVRLFLYETCDPSDNGFERRDRLFEQFERWAQQNRRGTFGRHKFYEAVETAGYRPVIRQGTRGFVGLVIRDEDEWGPPATEPGALVRASSEEPAPSAPSQRQGAEGAAPSIPGFTSDISKEGKGESLVKAGCTTPAPSAPLTAGHVDAPCTVCGATSMIALKRDTWPTCRMTPGCTGRHTPTGQPAPDPVPVIERAQPEPLPF